MTRAIEVQGLGKQYRLGEIGGRSLREDVNRWLARARGRAPPAPRARLWALRDVEFSVDAGERVGIIGRNGAGKSTLLKILSRITAPTTGVARLRGRTGSLLEVGTGFHPELTGRENVYLNGAILGTRRRELDRQLDAIVDFAELGDFIETPVKRYSSGMAMRLAFAVAAHLEAETLIVDEVLAVGDADFQRRCVQKMGEVSEQGRTVLFVSHNLRTVQALCPRALLVDEGRVVMDGATDTVVAHYIERRPGAAGAERWSSGDVTLLDAGARCEPGPGRTLHVEAHPDLRVRRAFPDLLVDFALMNEAGTRICHYLPAQLGHPPTSVDADRPYRFSVDFTIATPAPGEYTGDFFVHSRREGALLHVDHVPLFAAPGVSDAPELSATGFRACLVPRIDGRLHPVDPDAAGDRTR